MFRPLPQCWPHSFAFLSFFFATSFCFFACRILASCRYLEFLLQYNSVLKKLDQPPLLYIFFFKNPAKKAFFSYKSSHVLVNLLSCTAVKYRNSSEFKSRLKRIETILRSYPRKQFISRHVSR